MGIKPVSYTGIGAPGSRAIDYAIANKRKSVTLVHKGNIMKFTEGAFRDWGYQVAREFFGAVEMDGGPWCKIPEGKPGAGLVIKDAIADIALQQVLTRPEEFDVLATLNLNGDYLSDALAAQVGGIGIAPGGNINYITGHAIFEATHGTAPKYANQDRVNPGSVVLSGEMMLRYLGWTEAADLILKGLNGAIASKRVTYDFARQMDGATRNQMLRIRRQHHRPFLAVRMSRRPRGSNAPYFPFHSKTTALPLFAVYPGRFALQFDVPNAPSRIAAAQAAADLRRRLRVLPPLGRPLAARHRRRA